jgi:catechol 2,3-dioxygenase-like lactoylglutathione lyase family enzyme
VLGAAPFIGFIPVRDLATARTFYEGTLGLVVEEDSPFALVIDAGGTMLRLTAAPELLPQPFTVAGWKVANIEDTVSQLVSADVGVLRYENVEQDDQGIWVAPNGDRVAWFSDPDGNVLSLTQFAGAVVDDYWR